MKNELSTSMMLALKYKTPIITLEQAIADWLPHLSIETARRRAHLCTLPFPTFQAEPSKRAPHFVQVEDIANWLDESQARARKEWLSVNA